MHASLHPWASTSWTEASASLFEPDSEHRSAESFADEEGADDRNVDPAWMDVVHPAGTFIVMHLDSVSPGWRKVAARSIVKMLAVAAGSPERRRCIATMRVCSTSTELCFSAGDGCHADNVLSGIWRKARGTARTICKDCGRLARVRLIGEDESVTQCTKCVAPALLQHEIWELCQSVRFLKAVGRPIVKSQIPPLLRASFINTAVASLDANAEGNTQMLPAQFVRWAEGWRLIGEGLKVRH
ncbi:hypothetical protein [Variovorax boronicumulans]|uniref:hypothetical protein n=1 Tax=Variovorax boronicumulans TaxID=436515 RepID=UPI001C594344